MPPIPQTAGQSFHSVRLHSFVVELLHRANAARTIEATTKSQPRCPGFLSDPRPWRRPCLPDLTLPKATTPPRIAAYPSTVTNSDRRHPSRPCIANQRRPRETRSASIARLSRRSILPQSPAPYSSSRTPPHFNDDGGLYRSGRLTLGATAGVSSAQWLLPTVSTTGLFSPNSMTWRPPTPNILRLRLGRSLGNHMRPLSNPRWPNPYAHRDPASC